MSDSTEIILGVGDIGATKTPGATLKTFALGSCVAVILLDPKIRAVGMAHLALPKSATNPERALTKPGYFVDTGVRALFEKMAELGCDPKGKGMVVKVAGGAKVLDLNDTFDIGRKNSLAVKKNLWKYGLGPVAEDTGGSFSRTVELFADTGRVVLSSSEGKVWEI